MVQAIEDTRKNLTATAQDEVAYEDLVRALRRAAQKQAPARYPRGT